MNASSLVRTIFGVLLLSACQGTDSGPGSTQVRDSLGIRIVENATPENHSGVFATLDQKPVVEIGMGEGPTPFIFWPLEDAVETPDGDILIVDGGTREIRVFDGTGSHIMSYGGRGEGPGEFRTVPIIRFVNPDTILAYDPVQRRLTWFSIESGFVRDQALPGAAASASASVLGASRWELHPNGTLVGQKSTPDPQRKEGLVPDPLSLVIVSGTSGDIQWIRDLPGHPKVLLGRTGAPAFLHPTVGLGNWGVMVSPPRVVVADDPNGKWKLSVYDFGGRLVSSIRASIPRREVTETVATEALDFLRGLGDDMGQLRQDFLTAVERVPIPDSLPATSVVEIDASDRLWVKRWSGLWEKNGVDRYDVLDQSGRWVGWVDVSRDFGQILNIGEDHILFLWADEMDVPRVRKHRLNKPVKGGPV